MQTVTFTADGDWTAPAGVSSVLLEGIGGGGGGGGGACTILRNQGGDGGGGGGGASGSYGERTVDVQPGATYKIVVGVGGKGSPPGVYTFKPPPENFDVEGPSGGTGTPSKFGDLFTFQGGAGGGIGTLDPHNNSGGAGGVGTVDSSIGGRGGNYSNPPPGQNGAPGGDRFGFKGGVGGIAQVPSNRDEGLGGGGGGGGGASPYADGGYGGSSAVYRVLAQQGGSPPATGYGAGGGGGGGGCLGGFLGQSIGAPGGDGANGVIKISW